MKNYAILIKPTQDPIGADAQKRSVINRLVTFNDRYAPPLRIDTSTRQEWAVHHIPADWREFTGFRLVGEESRWYVLRQVCYTEASKPQSFENAEAALRRAYVDVFGDDVEHLPRFDVLRAHVLGFLDSPYGALTDGEYWVSERAA